MSAPGQPVLWIDPGKISGLALWTPRTWNLDVPSIHIDEFDFSGAADRIENMCKTWHTGQLMIGWEHFVIGQRTPPSDAHYAIEMIGVARRYATLHHCQILPKAMPDARKAATQQALEAIGWWPPGKKDAQSAAQHLLAWMLRTNCVPDDVMIKIRTMI